MKTIKLSILFIFVLFTTNSCVDKNKQEVLPKESFERGKFTINIYTDPLVNVGLVIHDSLQKDFLYVFGKKHPSGQLKSITNIIHEIRNAGVVINIKISKENLIDEVEVISSVGKRVLRFSEYSLTDRKVKVEIFDKINTQFLVEKQEVLLDPSMIEKLRNMQIYGQSIANGRVGAIYGSDCDKVTNFPAMAISFLSCFSNMTIKRIALYELCKAGSEGKIGDPTKIEYYLACTEYMKESAVNSCNQAKDDYKDFQDGKCITEPDPNLPPDLKCFIDAFDKSYTKEEYDRQVKKCLDDLEKEQKEENGDNKSANSWGDPHLTTFDGLAYDFQAWGEFIAVKSTTDNFEVQVRQEGVGNGRISFNRGFAVQTGQDVVCWAEKKLYINNILTNTNFTSLPLKEGASLSITKDKRNNNVLNIKSKYGDLVTVPVNSFDYTVKLSETRKGKIVGLLGDFDGKKENDLKMKNNEVITLESVKTSGISVKIPFNKLYPTFADNWRIEQKNSLFYYDSNKNTESFTKRNYPQGPIELTEEKRAWATGICKATGIDKEPYLSACIIDVAQTDDPNMASASLWMQQNQLKSNTLQVATDSDVNHFKNVKVTISESQGNLEDSCLVSFSTGQVFQLKDGAKYANLIDGLFLNYCSISLNTPQNIITCGFSCGVGRMNSVLVAQKWNKYRKGTIEFIGFASDDKPSDPNRVASSTWYTIITSNDIEKSFEKHYGTFRTDSNSSSTNVVQTASNCVPSLFIDKTLRRFLTEDGKKGLIKFNSWGKGKSGWWIEFDIKIQK